MGMSREFMIDVFIKEVRSVLEGVAVPVWNGALTVYKICSLILSLTIMPDVLVIILIVWPTAL